MTTVEAEKAEAMRRYNNRKSFRNILRTAAVASLCFLWFPTVMISLQSAGNWFYRTGAVFITDRSVVFVFTNILVALIFILSCDNNEESSSCDTEPDLYDQYTSSSAVIVTASAEEKVEDDDDDSNKQIVPAFNSEIEKEPDRETVTKGIYRRTKSEMKKEIIRPVMEIRRTESAKVVSTEWLRDEELRLKVETFIMKQKWNHIQEKRRSISELRLLGGGAAAAAASSGYGSC